MRELPKRFVAASSFLLITVLGASCMGTEPDGNPVQVRTEKSTATTPDERTPGARVAVDAPNTDRASPAGAAVDPSQQHVFYRDADGQIDHIWWDGSFHHDQWTSAAGAPTAAGDPTTMLTPGQQHVFYRGEDGQINHIWWDGSFHHDQWTSAAAAPSVAGNPAVMVTPGQQHVFYRGIDGNINHIWWDGSFHHDQWTSAAGAPVAVGGIATLFT